MEENTISTKDRILMESLKLFSQKGYDGVSMREIAAAVGIKGASIYSHFEGKQSIFEGIFTEMTKRYAVITINMQIPEIPEKEAASFYATAGEGALIKMAEGLFEFFAKDELVMMFRKLLFTEQNKNEVAAKFLKEYYLQAPLRFQTELFRNMQNLGKFNGFHAPTMALHFYSPIYYILCAYDLGESYDLCLMRLKEHVSWFCKIYVTMI